MKTNFKSFMEEGLIRYTFTERLERYKNNQVLDLIPFDIFDIESALANSLGYKKQDLADNFNLFLDMVKLKYDLYGLNFSYLGLDRNAIGQALGSKIYITDKGDALISSYALESYEDIGKIKNLDLKNSQVFSGKLRSCQQFRETLANIHIYTAVTGPMTTASGIRPLEKLLKDTRKDKENLKELLEISLTYTLDWVRIFTEKIGPGPIKIADPISSLDLLGPKQFDEFSLPYLASLVDEIIKITGHKPVLHICGHTQKIWSRLRELNISRFSVDNCEDMGELKDVLGDKIMIEGNLDPTAILLKGSPDDVGKETLRILKASSDSPRGMVLNAGCTISEYTPIENIEAFIESLIDYSISKSYGMSCDD